MGGELRGCIGTFLPTTSDVAAEVVENAVAAATRDPRFPPVAPGELALLEVSVDELTAPVPVTSLADLDPRRYGVIVEAGRRRGLLLPDLEGVDTVEQQVAIAARKAGIAHGEEVRLSRFEVKRYR
jgi:MEMO1 family protein